MFNKKTVEDIEIGNKRVLVRVDYNVPLDNEMNVTDDTRIRLSLPTIKYLLGKNSKVILMSHLGRPEGIAEDRFRLDPAAKRLQELLGIRVKKFNEVYSEEIKDYINNEMHYGEIVMLENLRFDPGEKENDGKFSKSLASLADVYVNDAFGAVHRAHASVEGITWYLPAVAGYLMRKEVEVLTSLLESPERPFLTILGGSKVSDKIKVIKNLMGKVDSLVIGGGMSYTFLKAQGYEIGKSICEDDQIDFARDMISLADKNKVKLVLPVDIVVSREFDSEADKKLVSIQSIPVDWMGMDIGERSIELFRNEILAAKTIFWNGPVGVFEWDRFANGTKNIAKFVAESPAVTVAGGGDTLAALKKYKVTSKFTHVSSGGGAAMELLEGKELPGVASLLDA